MNIVYRSIADMSNVLVRNLYKFPHDADLIVGVPRSGMLPANLLALFLNKPFTDIDSFIEGRVYSSGERGEFIKDAHSKKIIIMDDSFYKGGALNKVKNKIKQLKDSEKYDIYYGVVYTTSLGMQQLDFWCEVIDSDFRVFQWNLFHHKSIIGASCFDIDGVLCPDPPIDDDGPKYIDYIKNAPLLYAPSTVIDTLVSCRLEKYRVITERWLAQHNIKYRKLIMLDLKNKEERIKWCKHGEYKAQVYRNSSNILFVESSLSEANIIKKLSGKDVFCIETFQMLNADTPLDRSINFIFKLHNKVRNIANIVFKSSKQDKNEGDI